MCLHIATEEIAAEIRHWQVPVALCTFWKLKISDSSQNAKFSFSPLLSE